jgi:ATP-binding cassette subfamily G (WHITE) protein 2 (SNQ2)
MHPALGFQDLSALTIVKGASGAGKTTLLDVLAARKNIGIISGDVLLDGVHPGPAFQRGTAYAEQIDVHEGSQTVREALRFSAQLRQVYKVPLAEKYEYVEEVISLLEMENIADAVIGDSEIGGLSVEQRKRITIGVELAAKPELLLFLDEPTTGLDSQSAFNIVRFLKKLSNAGQAILCTIHQPNSLVFASFDRLLLLQSGGHCVYFGEIGEDASTLCDYFARNGAECPLDANPAEWILDITNTGYTQSTASNWADVWRNSVELARINANISQIKRDRKDSVSSPVSNFRELEYATPLWYQVKVVARRASLAFWRTPNYGNTTTCPNRLKISKMTKLYRFHPILQPCRNRPSYRHRIPASWRLTKISPVPSLYYLSSHYTTSHHNASSGSQIRVVTIDLLPRICSKGLQTIAFRTVNGNC